MGNKVNGLKKAFENLSNKTVQGATVGEVLADFNLQYVKVVTTISPVDSANTAVSAATVTLKTGATVGSGTAVTAETDGKYKITVGKYNYSIAKTGYTTKTGTFEVTREDARAETKTVKVTLATA